MCPRTGTVRKEERRVEKRWGKEREGEQREGNMKEDLFITQYQVPSRDAGWLLGQVDTRTWVMTMVMATRTQSWTWGLQPYLHCFLSKSQHFSCLSPSSCEQPTSHSKQNSWCGMPWSAGITLRYTEYKQALNWQYQWCQFCKEKEKREWLRKRLK